MIIECLEQSFAIVTAFHMGCDAVKRRAVYVSDCKGFQLINPGTEKRCHCFFPPRQRHSIRRSSYIMLTESCYTMLMDHVRIVPGSENDHALEAKTCRKNSAHDACPVS